MSIPGLKSSTLYRAGPSNFQILRYGEAFALRALQVENKFVIGAPVSKVVECNH